MNEAFQVWLSVTLRTISNVYLNVSQTSVDIINDSCKLVIITNKKPKVWPSLRTGTVPSDSKIEITLNLLKQQPWGKFICSWFCHHKALLCCYSLVVSTLNDGVSYFIIIYNFNLSSCDHKVTMWKNNSKMLFPKSTQIFSGSRSHAPEGMSLCAAGSGWLYL